MLRELNDPTDPIYWKRHYKHLISQIHQCFQGEPALDWRVWGPPESAHKVYSYEFNWKIQGNLACLCEKLITLLQDVDFERRPDELFPKSACVIEQYPCKSLGCIIYLVKLYEDTQDYRIYVSLNQGPIWTFFSMVVGCRLQKMPLVLEDGPWTAILVQPLSRGCYVRMMSHLEYSGDFLTRQFYTWETVCIRSWSKLYSTEARLKRDLELRSHLSHPEKEETNFP